MHIVRPNKSLGQPVTRTHAHLEISIDREIFMMVNKPKPIELQQHQEVLKGRFIGETVPLFGHADQELDQSALIIQFFATVYER